MIKRIAVTFAILVALATALAGSAVADVNAVTPSTNDINRTNGWAHFNVIEVGVGYATIEFVSTRSFASCFEYRSNGEPAQSPINFNPLVSDGLWPYTCRINNSTTLTLSASEYVEVRMVFGAETDERFDWTTVYVLSDAQTKDDCMNGGWATYGFANQGQCIRFINTGKDSR